MYIHGHGYLNIQIKKYNLHYTLWGMGRLGLRSSSTTNCCLKIFSNKSSCIVQIRIDALRYGHRERMVLAEK